MTTRRRRLLPILAAAIAPAALLFLWRGPPATRIVPAAARRAMAANLVASLPDGLHVVLCGAGGPMPDPRRSGPCVAVIAGKSLFVVDAGSGVIRWPRMPSRPRFAILLQAA